MNDNQRMTELIGNVSAMTTTDGTSVNDPMDMEYDIGVGAINSMEPYPEDVIERKLNEALTINIPMITIILVDIEGAYGPALTDEMSMDDAEVEMENRVNLEMQRGESIKKMQRGLLTSATNRAQHDIRQPSYEIVEGTATRYSSEPNDETVASGARNHYDDGNTGQPQQQMVSQLPGSSSANAIRRGRYATG